MSNAFAFLYNSLSHDSYFAGDGRVRKIDGRAQSLVDSGLAMPLVSSCQFTSS